MRGIRIDEVTISRVVKLYYEHWSYQAIARQTKISKTQVSRIIERAQHGISPKKQGNQFKLGRREKLLLKRMALKNRKMGVRQLSRNLLIPVSHMTVSRELKKLNITKKKFRRRPILTKDLKQKRIKFALENYPKKEELEKWVFSDEKKFRMDGPDGWNQFWVVKGDKKFKPKLSKDYGKYKGVMVWGAVSSKGLLSLERTQSTMNGDDYLKMVTGTPLKKIQKLHGKKAVFIQDNAPPHRKTTTIQGLKDSGLEVPDWPALSPDLNVMENVWSLISRRLYTGEKVFSNEEELWKGIEDVGKTVSVKDVTPFIDSFPSRLQKVIEKKGEYVLQK
jgi:transposase